MIFTVRLTLFMVLCSALFATNNPVPFVNQPLVPASVAPGGSNLQLTVNGTGFVAGSTVNWNGSPRATTFVNQGQLTATILSTDIATATTASITVTSPAPGGGASSVAFLPVRNQGTTVSLNATTFNFPQQPTLLAVGDFNKDGKQDVAVAAGNSVVGIFILLGNGDGKFTEGRNYSFTTSNFLISTDLNGDGSPDLVFGTYNSGVAGIDVMFGNGDGTFQAPIFSHTGYGNDVTLGDFNRDGALDIVSLNGSQLLLSLGNGDGTFQPFTSLTLPGVNSTSLTIGDFNGDGELDLALSDYNNGDIDIVLGNGDGTFQPPQFYPAGGINFNIATADINGDGILDLAVSYGADSYVTTLLGNGNGTFRAPIVDDIAYGPYALAFSDMNGDGHLDIVAQTYGYGAASLSLLLGDGNGSFQNYLAFGGSLQDQFAIADFNNDGKLDVVAPNGVDNTISVLLQDDSAAISLSTYTLKFPTQAVGTVSQPKLITVTNKGTSAVKFSGISTTANFSQLSNCKTVQPGGSCKVGVYFTPSISGNLAGYLSIADNGGGSPQLVTLSGTATIVELAPTSLNFGNQNVGSTSKSQNVILTNNGNGPLQISKVGIGGADPRDFYQVNACPAKLAAGSSCTITVLFHPTATGARSALLGVEDNGGGSPQTVALGGTGT